MLDKREDNGESITTEVKDGFGCITSDGYTWCEALKKCLKLAEEECPDNEKNKGCSFVCNINIVNFSPEVIEVI